MSSDEPPRTPRRHYNNRRNNHWKRNNNNGRRSGGGGGGGGGNHHAGSPSSVQDTNRKYRRNRNRHHHNNSASPAHQQIETRPYHVFDVFGSRGLFLVDGTVPVESLAAMGLVLPLPWMHADHHHLLLHPDLYPPVSKEYNPYAN